MGQAAIHGLKLTAVAIVAQAVLGMARTLCPDRTRASIAASAALIVLFAPPAIGQIAAIAIGAVLGAVACAPKAPVAPPSADRSDQGPRLASLAGLAVFALLFLPGGALLGDLPLARLFHAFYRSGALVFGGGHVVLPLLRDQVVAAGWVPDHVFLAGYGAAQALPGPLFSLAAYLGAVSKVGGGMAGAALAVVALSLAGLILVWALLPHWRWIRQFRAAQAITAGVNAAVVGILGVAFYNPVWLGAVATTADLAIVLVAFILLTAWKAPPLAVVGLCLAAAVAPVLGG